MHWLKKEFPSWAHMPAEGEEEQSRARPEGKGNRGGAGVGPGGGLAGATFGRRGGGRPKRVAPEVRKSPG